jgi:hypothetical protein
MQLFSPACAQTNLYKAGCETHSAFCFFTKRLVLCVLHLSYEDCKQLWGPLGLFAACCSRDCDDVVPDILLPWVHAC